MQATWTAGRRTGQEIVAKMNNQDIAEIFRQIAEILEIQGENTFRIRAYQKAAQNIAALEKDVAEIAKEGRLREIPGIGKDLDEKIKEILRKEYKESLSIEGGIKLSVSIFKRILGKNFDVDRLEAAYIGAKDKKFIRLSAEELSKFAK